MRRGVLVWTALLAAPIPASAQAGEAVAGMRQFFANLPQGAFDLSDVEIVTGSAGGTTVFANTLLAGAKTQLLVSLAATRGAREPGRSCCSPWLQPAVAGASRSRSARTAGRWPSRSRSSPILPSKA